VCGASPDGPEIKRRNAEEFVTTGDPMRFSFFVQFQKSRVKTIVLFVNQGAMHEESVPEATEMM